MSERMFNIKYYKDLSHNYIILINEEASSATYQEKMLEKNQIKHLLNCNIRNIDEKIHFYYEISSKQNLKIFFAKNKITMQQLIQLLDSILEASKEVKAYFLEDNNLLLEAEYIYINPETEEYFFLYYPYVETEELKMKSLAEFLVEAVNREEEAAVEAVYHIYEAIQNQTFFLPYIIKSLETKEEEAYLEEEVKYKPECGTEYFSEETEKETIWETPQESKNKSRGSNRISLVLVCICLFAAAVIFLLWNFCILSVQEMIIYGAGFIVLITTSVFLLIFIIFLSFGRKGKKHIKPEIKEEKNSNTFYYEIKENKMPQSKNTSCEYGNTVFLEEALSFRENKLYGTNKGNKYQIDLETLPCTIGKMAGSVDVLIKDSTISRIHAKFTRDGEEIWVTDLNSTNGTFKNGLRLEPNETVPIEPGDEIRFGKMSFSYR